MIVDISEYSRAFTFALEFFTNTKNWQRGIIANFVLPYICYFLLDSNIMILVYVKLDFRGY